MPSGQFILSNSDQQDRGGAKGDQHAIFRPGQRQIFKLICTIQDFNHVAIKLKVGDDVIAVAPRKLEQISADLNGARHGRIKPASRKCNAERTALVEADLISATIARAG